MATRKPTTPRPTNKTPDSAPVSVPAEAAPETESDQIDSLGLQPIDDYLADDDDGSPAAPDLPPDYDASNIARDAGTTAFESGRQNHGTLVDDFLDRVKEEGNCLIWMKMGGKGQVNGKLWAPGPGGLTELELTPFCITPPLSKVTIMSVLKPVKHRKYGYYWQRLNHAPERRDCSGSMSWRDKISGQTIKSCPYAGCKHHPMPEGLHHSIHQAQAFIAKLKTVSVIQMYVRNFDHRPLVAAFATLVIMQRQKRLAEQTGLGAENNTDLTF